MADDFSGPFTVVSRRLAGRDDFFFVAISDDGLFRRDRDHLCVKRAKIVAVNELLGGRLATNRRNDTDLPLPGPRRWSAASYCLDRP
jgi:hypothetical protein